jgi:hypothetical protein
MPYLRQDMAAIYVTVAGKRYGDTWAEAEGGDLEADDAKTRPGGMGREVSVGGPVSRSDVTARIQLTDVTVNWLKDFEKQAGVGDVLIRYAYLGRDRHVLGPTHSMRGTLKTVKRPDIKSDQNDVGMIELIISADELAA